MNARLILWIYLSVFLSLPLSAQNVVLSGQVRDASTGEPLIGVTVYNTNRRTGTTTNSQGNYTITLPSGRALELVFSYVGYASETQTITLTHDTKLDIQLSQDTQNLREVQVYGTRHNFGVQSSQMSAIAVSAEQIKRMPALLGEVDVLKSLQRLPGVQSSGEGRSGIFVRGGDYDQNLFTLDGITLYNPEHLQGFTSAINADVIDDVVLYKGAFPARYGSRLSSVVDVSLREGDMERHRLSATAGMLASHIQAEGPLWKGHTSYNIAARVSYFSAIVKPMLQEVIYDNPGQMENYSHMRYWDVNAKLTHRFSDNDKLSAVFYMGHDVNNATPNETAQHFKFSTKNEMGTDKSSIIDNAALKRKLNNWNNLLGGLHYNHEFSPFLRLDAGVSYSGYDYKLDYVSFNKNQIGIDLWGHGDEAAELYYLRTTENSTLYRSNVHDMEAKADLNYLIPDRHDIHGGIQVGRLKINPELGGSYYSYVKRAQDEETVAQIGMGEERYTVTEVTRSNLLTDEREINTLAVYAEDDWDISGWLKANVGIRLQGYATGGNTKLAVEPRASLRLLLDSSSSLKASYTRMSQAIFLLSSSSLTAPSDVWVAMGSGMDLGIADQLSIGLNHEFRNGFQLSVEGYYKWLDGVLDYSEGSTYLGMNNWSELIVQGKGRAYGVELLAQKNIGNTTGLVGYTWSKSLRTFDRPDMELNGGKEFFAPSDRRHNFNISITQRLSKNWDLSASWTYLSGRRTNFATTTITGSVLDEFNNYLVNGPTSDATYEENPAYEARVSDYYQTTRIRHLLRSNTYRQRNGFVLPAVHRLDVSLRHHGSIGIGEMICDIGIYNLYNQQNISTVYWGYENNRRTLKGVCMFPIMPSISLTLIL